MKWQLSNGYGKRSLVETESGDTSPSSGGVCGGGRGPVRRPKASSAEPFSIACLTAHARNPSAARHHGSAVSKIPIRSIPDPCTNARHGSECGRRRSHLRSLPSQCITPSRNLTRPRRGTRGFRPSFKQSEADAERVAMAGVRPSAFG
jgi:hypothetical protein